MRHDLENELAGRDTLNQRHWDTFVLAIDVHENALTAQVSTCTLCFLFNVGLPASSFSSSSLVIVSPPPPPPHSHLSCLSLSTSLYTTLLLYQIDTTLSCKATWFFFFGGGGGGGEFTSGWVFDVTLRNLWKVRLSEKMSAYFFFSWFFFCFVLFLYLTDDENHEEIIPTPRHNDAFQLRYVCTCVWLEEENSDGFVNVEFWCSVISLPLSNNPTIWTRE